MAVVGIAGAAEQIEPVTQPFEELLGREQLRTCGGELEREGESVEPLAELVQRRGSLELGAARVCPLEKERGRFVVG